MRRELEVPAEAKINFLTVSEPLRLGLLSGILGGASWRSWSDPYQAARAMVAAAADEANERALWAHYGL